MKHKRVFFVAVSSGCPHGSLLTVVSQFGHTFDRGHPGWCLVAEKRPPTMASRIKSPSAETVNSPGNGAGHLTSLSQQSSPSIHCTPLYKLRWCSLCTGDAKWVTSSLFGSLFQLWYSLGPRFLNTQVCAATRRTLDSGVCKECWRHARGILSYQEDAIKDIEETRWFLMNQFLRNDNLQNHSSFNNSAKSWLWFLGLQIPGFTVSSWLLSLDIILSVIEKFKHLFESISYPTTAVFLKVSNQSAYFSRVHLYLKRPNSDPLNKENV